MGALALEIFVFVLVFGAVCGAYALGRDEHARTIWSRGLCQICRYSPPIDIVLEYRSEGGSKSLRRVGILESLYGCHGRLYLFGICRQLGKPRMFRVDRIICIGTTDGEIIDTRQFLIERLGISPSLCAGVASRPDPLSVSTVRKQTVEPTMQRVTRH